MLSINSLQSLLHSDTFHSEYSPIGPNSSVMLDLNSISNDDGPLAKQISHITCPVIGVGATRSRIAEACDVLAATSEEADHLADKIRTAPIAAMVLTQLLKATESLDIRSALTMESLAYATLQGGPEFSHWLNSRNNSKSPPPEKGPAVRLTRNDDTLTIEINRPQNRNAISTEVRDGLVEAFQLTAADTSIAHIHLRGAGKCFSTGGELSEFGITDNTAIAHVHRSIQLPALWMINSRDRITSHLHSACIGAGIEIPAFAKHVIATSNSFFQLPELSMGLIPGAGGCVSIPRRIGRQRTAWMVLSGRKINATTALQWGLVDQIAP